MIKLIKLILSASKNDKKTIPIISTTHQRSYFKSINVLKSAFRASQIVSAYTL